jgi:phage terminase large subunit-like protein
VVDDPKSNCLMYRRTNPQLDGGFWPNGRAIWTGLPDYAPAWLKPKNIREQKKEIILGNGAKIKYQQAENTARACDDAQGQELTLITVDEATQHDMVFLKYLMSRLRSPSRHFSRMVMSCNPNPDHPIREMIDWYIGEDGFVIPERDGKIRYFISENDEFLWGNSREELGEKYNIEESRWESKILSFSFVSGTIYDNPIMIEMNPSYLAFLEGLNEVDKAQLLHGNWNARPKGANYWVRDWVKPITLAEMPDNVVTVRAYDLAATERSQANKWPDPTACGKLSRCKDGYYYMQGDYHKDFYDDVLDIYGQFCKRSGDRDNHIIKQAIHDGDDCLICLPVDAGAAGKTTYEAMSAKIGMAGFRVKPDPTPNNKSKLTRFQNFATNCENGLVYVVVDTFDKKTLEFIYKQLEAFDGERSTSNRKDEFPDLWASATNLLMKERLRRPMSNATPTATKLAQFKR